MERNCLIERSKISQIERTAILKSSFVSKHWSKFPYYIDDIE